MKTILNQNRSLIFLNLLLIIITSILSIFIAYFIQKIIDIAVKSDMEELKEIILFSIVFLVIYAIFNYLKSYFAKRFQNNYICQLRKTLFKKILGETPGNYRKLDSSDYLSILTNDIQLFNEGLLSSAILIIQNSISAIIAVAALLYLNSFIAIIVIFCIIAMYFVPHIFGKIIQIHQKSLSHDLKDLTALTKSYLNGYDVIFSYLIQNKCIANFAVKNEVVANRRMKMDKEISLSESLSSVLSIGTEFIVLFIAAWGVIHKSMSIGTMVAIMQLSGAFIQPIMIIMQNIPKVIGGKTIVERFAQVLLDTPAVRIGVVKSSFLQRIELKNICFSFNENQMILKNINCTFDKNKKYAIIGGSGSGKSTLVRLMAGLIDTYKGEILFDDAELSEIGIHQVLSFITITQQNSFLFDSSILENITLGSEGDEDLLSQVCQMSGVNMFLDTVPEGINCSLVECGSNLSGGQKQRISIARALFQKKPIMILDESTAAVDKKTAFDIESRLLRIPDLTLIIITHNLDPEILQKYDKILFIENGQIAGFDSYTHLYELNEGFQNFVNIAYDN